MLEKLTLNTFVPLQAQTFTLALDGGATLPLLLVEATALPGHAFPGRQRDPFHLRFKGPLSVLLDQRIHPLLHPAVGTLELFIVPIGQEPDGFIYQAVFS